MNFKQIVLRKFAAPLIVSTKAHVLLRSKNRTRAVIMFHGVTAQVGESVRHMHLTEFIRVLTLLRKEYELVSLDEIHDESNKKSALPRLAITFDDGYLNNFKEACPVLEEMKIPATFFVITEALENSNFTLPIDLIDCIIEKYAPNKIVLDGCDFVDSNGSYYSNAKNLNIFEYVIANTERMRVFSDQLRLQFPHDFLIDQQYSSRVRFIDQATLKELSSNPLFSFASHSRTHANCALIDKSSQQLELESSKKIIEQISGKSCSSIAYPYGLYTETTRKLTKESGYKMAYAVKYQLTQDFEEHSIVQRIGISNTTTAEVNIINIARSIGKLGF